MDVFTPAQEARIRAIVEEMATISERRIELAITTGVKEIVIDKHKINAALFGIGVPKPPAGEAQTPPDTRSPGT